jgi:hypothetical protein
MVRDLDRGHPDAAGTRMNEHAFSFSQSSDIVQGMPGRHKNNWDRRGFLKRKAVRNTAHAAAARNRLRRQAKYSQTKNPVARFHVGNSRTYLSNDPANFVSENSSVRRFTRIKCERLEHIAEIHTRGFDVDDDLARTAGWLREWPKCQSFQVTAFT